MKFYFFLLLNNGIASHSTPPVLASARPVSDAPVLKVMDCIAITVPLNTEVVPKVAELPTCQKKGEALSSG